MRIDDEKKRVKNIKLINKIIIGAVILFFIGLFVDVVYTEATYFSKVKSFLSDVYWFTEWVLH